MAEMSRENVIGGLRRMAVVEKMRYSQVPNPQYRVNANTVETAIALLSQQEEQKDVVSIRRYAADLTDNEVEDNLRDAGFTIVPRGDFLGASAEYDTWRRFMEGCRR